ncbi:hypothetical protein [Aquimarina sp. 2201CG14-23]|uniref:hypothetical protein n=1 Tax=Aquimarina mycalae TaxID=3040073 RepID=UPI00247817AC|nr:hypothetical protein [Aquimarina sp. 2201CG14-23]MDH7448379.1 hypothetical protein [Aquimarina sp. 2201CG14-23]
MQKAPYLFIFLLCYIGFSQESDRLRGKIVVDTFKTGTINVINLTKGIGTITDGVGFFEIKAKVGDEIIFSSVQHQQKTYIVTKKDLKQAGLSIKLEIKINELDEVTVSQYDLSGEVKEDIKKIKTYEDNLPMFNAQALDLTPFVHEKGATTVRNTTVDHRKNATAFNFIAAGRMIASLFKKKDAKKTKYVRIPEISDFYNSNFLVQELKIPETELYNFIDYLNQQKETKNILKSGDELRILEFTIMQSKVFNENLSVKD